MNYCKCSYPTTDSITAKNGTCGECGELVEVYGTSCYNAVTMNKNLNAAAPKLLEACKALPLDCEFEDAADFKDNAVAFMRAMQLAREAIAIAEPQNGE